MPRRGAPVIVVAVPEVAVTVVSPALDPFRLCPGRRRGIRLDRNEHRAHEPRVHGGPGETLHPPNLVIPEIHEIQRVAHLSCGVPLVMAGGHTQPEATIIVTPETLHPTVLE